MPAVDEVFMSQSARITLLLLLFPVAVVIAIITSGKYSLTVNELWTVVSSKLTGHIEESNSKPCSGKYACLECLLPF